MSDEKQRILLSWSRGAVTSANNSLLFLSAPLFPETYANSHICGSTGRPVSVHLFIVFIEQV